MRIAQLLPWLSICCSHNTLANYENSLRLAQLTQWIGQREPVDGVLNECCSLTFLLDGLDVGVASA